MRYIDDEWARVAQNPDNMLVSDSLRESIEKLMSSDTPASESIPVAVVQSDSDEVQMTLLRVEQTPKGWALVGITSVSEGVKILQVNRESWKKAVILQGEDTVVWSRELSNGDVRMDVDFPVTEGTCTITLGFTSVSVQTRVL